MYITSENGTAALPAPAAIAKDKTQAAENGRTVYARITLSLKQKGGISIRSYSTRASDGEDAAPDYE